MSFCKDFKELYGVNQKGDCPWHAYLTPTHVDGGACAVPDSTVADLSSAQFNHSETRCADIFEYFFRNTQYDHMLFMWKLLGLVWTVLVLQRT